MTVIPKITFPITMKVNWNNLTTFTAFSISRSVDKFIDTFSITLSNYMAESSITIPIWWLVEMYNQWVLFFRWLIENKKVSYPDVGSTMTVSGREEIVVLAETDADPTIWPFNWWTDNAIITKMVQWYSRQLSLWTATKIKKYTITGRSVKVWQVLDDICKMNDFLLYKKGSTLYKRPRPVNEYGLHNWPKYYLNVNDWNFYWDANRIISVDIIEDIASARSHIRWYTYTTWKAKAQAQATIENKQLSSGSYASRIRNLSGMKWYKINRIANCMTPAKDAAELKASAFTILRSSDLQASIEVTVYGIQDIWMLDNIRVDIPQEMIWKNFFVKQIDYTMADPNKLTTKVTLMPYMNYYQQQ